MEIVNSSKKNGRTGILVLPNATEVLVPLQVRLLGISNRKADILQAATPKEGKQVWAICTSGMSPFITLSAMQGLMNFLQATHVYAEAALKNTSIQRPTAFVASEDVSTGKPR
jgi:hypothetical protein